MTEVEADALNILSKSTETAEVPMSKYMIEGALNTIEGMLWETLSSHMQWRSCQKKIQKICKKDDRGGSGCAQDAVKNDIKS